MKKAVPLLALLTLALTVQAGAAGTTVGTAINNTGFLDYTTDDAVTSTATSNVVTATVTQVYNVSVTPDGTTATPGQTVYTGSNTTGATTNVLTYTLTNTGNGTDSFNLTTVVGGSASAGSVKYYLETSATPDGYTPGTDTLITSIANLPADGSKTFYAVYDVPANTAGGTQFDITPVATSVGDNTKVDSNNLGRIIEKSIYDFSLTSSQNKTVTTPGTATYTNTITNTGNVVIPVANFAASSTNTDTNAGGTALGAGSFTETYAVNINGTTYATSPTLAGAFANASAGGNLAVGANITITTVVTAPAGRTVGDKDVAVLSAALSGALVTNSVSVNNNRATAVTNTDTTTVVKGLGAVSKAQALCTVAGVNSAANCPASAGAAASGINVKPGEYVVYYLSATNSGNSAIFNSKVRDALPAGVNIYSLAATTTQTGTPTPKVLYAVTNGSTTSAWTADPTTLTVGAGATVYAAVDTDNSGTITTADTLAPGSSILFRIKVRVNDGVNNLTSPVTDPQTVN